MIECIDRSILSHLAINHSFSQNHQSRLPQCGWHWRRQRVQQIPPTVLNHVSHTCKSQVLWLVHSVANWCRSIRRPLTKSAASRCQRWWNSCGPGLFWCWLAERPCSRGGIFAVLKIPYDFHYVSLMKDGKLCSHLDKFCYIHTSLKWNV